jgi:hypothetical protein
MSAGRGLRPSYFNNSGNGMSISGMMFLCVIWFERRENTCLAAEADDVRALV